MGKTWHQVGQIRFQEDGSPVLVPFPDSVFLGEKSPYSLTKTFEEGLNTFVFDNICDLAGGMESGYRALGALGNASSMLSARQSAGCRGIGGATTVNPGNPAFQGGQCPVLYNVSDQVRTTVPPGPLVGVNTQVLGPIVGLIEVPVDSERVTLVLRHSNGVGGFQNTSWGGLFGPPGTIASTAFALARSDGQPDNCGSLPSNPSLPAPDPELPPMVEIGDVLINPTFVEATIDDRDNNIKLSVPIGAVIFGGVTGAEFNVGDIPVRILPDLQVQVGAGDGEDGDDTPSLPPGKEDGALARIAREIDEFDSRLLSQLEEMERDLEAIGQELDGQFQQIDGVFSALDCEGEVLEYPFAGRGIVGLASMINAGTIALQQTPAIVCDQEEGPPLGPLVLAIAGSVQDAYESRVISFGEDVRRVVLVVEPGESASIYRFDNQLTMGKFGWWGVGPIYDGVPTPLNWQQVTLTQQAFDVTQRGWGMRLTLNRGVGYSVFVQEV